MRTVNLFFLLLATTAASAQPGKLLLRLQPCGAVERLLYPLDSTRADLRLYMLMEGTDDVPSSGGHCIQSVATLSNAQLLHVLDAYGGYDLWDPAAHGSLHPDSLRTGLASGRYRWQMGDVNVVWRGYGSAAKGSEWIGLNKGNAIAVLLRVETKTGVQLAVLQLLSDPQQGFTETRVLGRALEDEPLYW